MYKPATGVCAKHTVGNNNYGARWIFSYDSTLSSKRPCNIDTQKKKKNTIVFAKKKTPRNDDDDYSFIKIVV